MLRTENLSYSYRWRGSRPVIAGLNWSARPGAVTMLLGPNGAGKSTLLKLLCGHLRPSAGRVCFDGEPGRDGLRREVGWMPQDIQPARGMRAVEQVEYAGWLAGLPRRAARAAADEAIERVGLSDKAKEKSSDLSGGQLRRLGLAQALVQSGSVLLLDEPTAGLDPAQAMNFRYLLRHLDFPGGIVVSTHQATDLAADIDAVVVLADGQVRFDAPIEDFRSLAGESSGHVDGVNGDVMGRAYAQVMNGTDR